MYLILKGTKSKKEEFQTAEMISAAEDGDLGPAAVPAAIAAAIAVAITAAAVPYMSGKAVEAAEALEVEMKEKVDFDKAPRKRALRKIQPKRLRWIKKKRLPTPMCTRTASLDLSRVKWKKMCTKA